MTEPALPAPLVPAEVVLKDYDYMPLYFKRLFGSDTWVLGTDEQRIACLYLWTASWHGDPAASLPNDDRALAHHAHAERRWTRLRPHCLRGWVLCADSRLYHPIVAEIAMEAYEARRDKSRKGKAGAARRWGSGSGTTPDMLGHSSGNGNISSPSSSTSPTFKLPDWVKPEVWDGFVAMRREMKHPLTDRAKVLIVQELAELRGRGQDPNACLDQSVSRSWRGVFEIKGAGAASSRQGALEDRNRGVVDRFARGGG